jgi:hypothetical protein
MLTGNANGSELANWARQKLDFLKIRYKNYFRKQCSLYLNKGTLN